MRIIKQDPSYIYFEEFFNQLNLIYFSYVYIYNRSRVTSTRANKSYYGPRPLYGSERIKLNLFIIS
jgi:hypothetical protein